MNSLTGNTGTSAYKSPASNSFGWHVKWRAAEIAGFFCCVLSTMRSPKYSSLEIYASGNRNTSRVKLSQNILLPKNVYPRIAVSNFLMPNSLYNIQSFTVYVNELEHTIPTGYYTVEQLIDAFSEVATLSYDPVSLLFNISTSMEFAPVTKLEVPVNNYLGVIGTVTRNRNGSKYYVFENGDFPIEGKTIPNLSGPSNFFIRIEGLNYDTVNSHGAIARVPVSACNGQCINYNPTELVHYILTNQNILSFVVVLQDANGNLQNINGANWSMTISMHFDYRPGPPLNFPNSRSSDGGMVISRSKPRRKKQ